MKDILDTSQPNLKLRFASEADLGLIYEFIQALADFEELSHEVVTDLETLRRSLFGEDNVAEVILAEFKGQPAGFALFFPNFSTFLGKPGLYLEDLFVKPEFRGNGIGKELLACLARTAVQRGCGRFEWSVLNWNEPAIRFYRNLGAQAMDGWTGFRITGDSLLELAGRMPDKKNARDDPEYRRP